MRSKVHSELLTLYLEVVAITILFNVLSSITMLYKRCVKMEGLLQDLQKISRIYAIFARNLA